jgi:hypothetical protein
MLAEVSMKAVDYTVLEVSSSRGVTKLSSSVSSAESIPPTNRGGASPLGSSSKLAIIFELSASPCLFVLFAFPLAFLPLFLTFVYSRYIIL